MRWVKPVMILLKNPMLFNCSLSKALLVIKLLKLSIFLVQKDSNHSCGIIVLRFITWVWSSLMLQEIALKNSYLASLLSHLFIWQFHIGNNIYLKWVARTPHSMKNVLVLQVCKWIKGCLTLMRFWFMISPNKTLKLNCAACSSQ